LHYFLAGEEPPQKRQRSTDLDSGVQRDAKLPFCYANCGSLYLVRGEYEKAISDFTEVVKLVPSDAMALSRRGQAYEALGQRDHALSDFQSALQKNPKLISAMEGVARLMAKPSQPVGGTNPQ
jgi:tetratricopeptide (TPR) repeat protein